MTFGKHLSSQKLTNNMALMDNLRSSWPTLNVTSGSFHGMSHSHWPLAHTGWIDPPTGAICLRAAAQPLHLN